MPKIHFKKNIYLLFIIAIFLVYNYKPMRILGRGGMGYIKCVWKINWTPPRKCPKYATDYKLQMILYIIQIL